MRANSGIYRIVNASNGKFYIGSTSNLRARKSQHFRALENGSHHNVHLQRSYNKHGKGSFVYEVLETCDKDNLISREQFYIDSKIFKNLYNIKSTADSNKGMNFTSSMPVFQIDVKTNAIIGEYKSGTVVGKKLGIHQAGISACCRGKQPTAGGYKWKYK